MLSDQLFIGLRAMPPLPVSARAGQYPYISKESGSLLRRGVKRRGPGAAYARDRSSYETDNYTCIEYGCEAPVPDDEARDVARFFSLESFELKKKMRQIQLDHEIRVATALFAPATFALTTSATAYTAANLATFDLGLDVDLAKDQILGRGEDISDLSLVMSNQVFLRARASTRLQNRIRGTLSTDTQLILDAQAMADALGVKEVLIGRVSYDTTAEGNATSSMSAIWSNTYCWLGKVNQAKGPDDYFSGSVGHTLYWEQDAALMQVEEYREDQTRSKIIRGRQNTDEKIILATAGQLLVTQYS